ncbi:MAG TPA: peptidylprolyl isomerase [Acidobacteriaceae bacterium]|nr:peptidylprolyl isomerase [Acidobacteriaceae bacterium]
MKSLYRAFLVLSVAAFFAATGFAQQSTAPADQTSTAASSQSSAQSSDQNLPDSPGAQVPVDLQPSGPTAVFDTSMGRMTCKLFSKFAPMTVANFIGLAEGAKDWTNPATHQTMHGKPLYNGTIFHRVIPGFMIQGGDPLGTGEGDPGYFINDEIDPNLNFEVAGRLAMANSGPNTDGSQFFITVAPYPSLDQHYTIFGQCDQHSVLVAQTISEVERDANNKPLEPVALNKVTIVPNGQPLPPPLSSNAAPAAAATTPQTNP